MENDFFKFMGEQLAQLTGNDERLAEFNRASVQDWIDVQPGPVTILQNEEFLLMETEKKPAHRPRKLATSENLAYWLQRNTTAHRRKTAKQIAEIFGVTTGYAIKQLQKLVNDPKYKVNRVVFRNTFQYYGYISITPTAMVESRHK